uniref:RING-type domain-containing protein n=1 Tax=Parascaris univalens TaxID=6257 RepID=A0A915ASK4_PARUN
VLRSEHCSHHPSEVHPEVGSCASHRLYVFAHVCMEECSERVPLSSTFSARKQQWRCSAGVGRQPQLKESFWQCFDPFVQL